MSRISAIAIGCLSLGLLEGCLAVDEAGDEAEVTAELAGEGSQQIIGGTATTEGEYSGVVALLIAPTGLCTGTMIHEQWILTAAHCFRGNKGAADVQVLFDRLNIRGNGGSVGAAAQVVVHPQYTEALGDNDIALVKLTKAEPMRTRYPVARNVAQLAGEVIQVGYGAATAPAIGSGIQRKLVTKSTPCASVGAGVDANKVLCFAADDGNGTCFGDSGGPSFAKAGTQLIVAGVTSFGANEQCTGYDVATMVASEITFIDQYVPKFTRVPTAGEVEGEDAAGCNTGGGGGGGWILLLAATLGLGGSFRRRRLAAMR
jgi:secreted trypsin-like serine protease